MTHARPVLGIGRISLLFVAMALLIGGCSSEPKQPVGPREPKTDPSQVKFYAKKPSGKYDLLGTVQVEITPDMRWDERGQAPRAFAALRQKAADMGANGLLFDIEQGDYDVLAGARDGKDDWMVPIRQRPNRTAVAYAIWVK